MNEYFNKVKEYILQLDYVIVKEDEQEGVFVIEKEEELIKNMIIAIDEETVIIVQPLFRLNNPTTEILKKLLLKNRDLISGALALDDNDVVIYRDTLQAKNLDLNELDTSISSLSILLSESGDEFSQYAQA